MGRLDEEEGASLRTWPRRAVVREERQAARAAGRAADLAGWCEHGARHASLRRRLRTPASPAEPEEVIKCREEGRLRRVPSRARTRSTSSGTSRPCLPSWSRRTAMEGHGESVEARRAP